MAAGGDDVDALIADDSVVITMAPMDEPSIVQDAPVARPASSQSRTPLLDAGECLLYKSMFMLTVSRGGGLGGGGDS